MHPGGPGFDPDFILVGEIARYRIAVEAEGVPNLERRRTGGVDVGENTWEIIARGIEDLQVEYLNGAGWNDVNAASSVVRAWASPNVADGADTTQQVGSGTFVTPNAGFDEVNGLAGGTSLDFSGSDEVEVEYCVQIRSAVVSDTDTIQLRVKGLDSYTKIGKASCRERV